MAVLSRPAPNGRFINAEAAKWPDIQNWPVALIKRPLGRLLMKMALPEACSCLCLDKTATGAGLDKTAIGPAFDELAKSQFQAWVAIFSNFLYEQFISSDQAQI